MEQICDFQITDTYDRKRFIQYIFLLGKNMHTQDVIGLFTAKDMTAQVERQHLLQSALKQAKGATVAREVFLSNMSHDIRTPLNAIIGYTELAEKNSGFKDKVDGYIEQIRMASEQLLSIVTESMEVTRMESGNFNLSNSDFNLNNLLDELKKSFEKQFAAKNIEFEMDKSGIENHDVIADFVRMKEMIGQLLDNAVKYTNSKGKIRLIVRENNINLKGYRKYEFVIEDTGIGMSKEFQEKMFEPFSRENNTTHSGVLGTGLGLALVNNIVDMMEGEIDVRSAPGKGTSFSIKVLLRLQKEQTAKESAEDKEIAQYSDVHNVHVLLAEDNDINREIITELLSENGYVVDSGENGAVVLEKLKSAPAGYYSIVLMDIQMPVMDGYEAARAIRKLDNKQLANIPIVALSANAFAEDFQRSREAGMDAHVTKPIDTHYLFEVMQQMM